MTFLGHPTIAEEVDLIAAKDYQTKQLSDAFKAFSPTWIVKDGPGMAKWLADWGKFWDRWQSARRLAQAEILAAKINPLPNSQIIALAWNGILSAFTQTPGHWGPGDFQDLFNRFTQAGGRTDMSQTPQPRQGTDADLKGLHATDAVLKTVEHTPIVGPLTAELARDLGVGRDTADSPKGSEVTKAKWGLGAIVAAGLLGTVVVAKVLK